MPATSVIGPALAGMGHGTSVASIPNAGAIFGGSTLSNGARSRGGEAPPRPSRACWVTQLEAKSWPRPAATALVAAENGTDRECSILNSIGPAFPLVSVCYAGQRVISTRAPIVTGRTRT